MYRLGRFLTGLFLLVFLTPFVYAQEEKLPVTTSYYPLAVGNTWSYRAGENRFSFRVSKIEKVGNTPCARLELIINGKSVSHEHISVTKDGVYRASLEGKPVTPPVKFLELPPKVGARWDVDSKIAGQVLKGSFKIGQDKIKVSGVDYNATTVTGQDLMANGVKLTLTYYFAENVGMVKQVMDMAGQKVVIELEKFEKGKE